MNKTREMELEDRIKEVILGIRGLILACPCGSGHCPDEGLRLAIQLIERNHEKHRRGV